MTPTLPTHPTALAATLKNLPERPGVYMMKDACGNAIGDDLAEIVTYDDRMAEAARLLGLASTSPQ